jgi:hypothetical protein
MWQRAWEHKGRLLFQTDCARGASGVAGTLLTADVETEIPGGASGSD